ncbi:hypothetical protein [Sphingomonas quercus]|uniref:MmcQ/YjbR family DNA-binding protein n=1 Tax=Sphingomonas quercus TaxID=2842451 RepID=A0ABS6BFV1_9SPHN|nr:hypothetical protein [Sphingomonas quercus]MBU3076707.1 hypothetical protein [Sphingomonas quercus]
MSFDWDAVVAEALSLPEIRMESHYGSLVPKLGGKALAAPGRHPDEAFVLMLPLDTVAMLVEADPAHFYQTPHYVGWPGVLVRWTTPFETVAFWLQQAWDYRASKKLRSAHGRR